MFREFWNGLGRGAQAGLAAGAALIVVGMVTVAFMLFRTDYQVLFADLAPQDAAAMIAELDRMKVPYRIGEGGNTILVDRDLVHKTRIKLMGKDLPLHGGVGLELFNNADFGMTEFAQKVNYQRALQGEITRTILSLSEIEAARVHLAMPEEGLFRRASGKPKASITLTVKKGQTLRPEQVSGIQRLVAAAVPAILAQDVTIVDQHGVALTRVAQADGDSGTSSLRLDLKKEMEAYLNQKASAVLEHAFGPGEAIASVDVTLNMDQVRVTTEDVVGAPGRGGQSQAGVIVREKEMIRDTGTPLEIRVGNPAAQRASSSSQREVEYQVGRRVEQLVSSPGSVRKIQVVAVVRKGLDAERLEQIRGLIAAAVGASVERGDSVVVQTIEGTGTSENAATSDSARRAETIGTPDGNKNGYATDGATGWTKALSGMSWQVVVTLALLLACLAGAAAGILLRRPGRDDQPMTLDQRNAALMQLREWMARPNASDPMPVQEPRL